MALDTYANLKTAINSFLNVGTSDTSSVIEDIISLGERRIWRELRVREMEVSLSYTMTTVAIPTGFLDFKFATYIDTSDYEWPLEIVDAKWLRNRFPTGFGTSRPVYIATEADNFVFGPSPDVSTYVLHGVFYKKTGSLSTSTSTDNLIFQRNPDIYLMAALSQAEAVIGRDARTAIWEARYQSIRDALNMENTQGNDRVRATEF
jgi:hypothetical protein